MLVFFYNFKGERMRKLINLGLSIAVAGALFTGCATTQLQTKAKLTKTVVLDHSKNNKKAIYLQVTNTSGGGGENMELFSSLQKNLEEKGYVIVKDSKDAGYGLFINVLFANNLREANAIKNGMKMGVTAGGASAITGGSGADSLLIGVTAALGAMVVGTALEDDVFRAVVDIAVRDYTSEDVATTRTIADSGSKVNDVPRSGIANSLAGPLGTTNGAGDMQSGISEVISSTTVKNYEEHRTRSFVEAVKMDLKLEEAMPILEAKLTRQIANLF